MSMGRKNSRRQNREVSLIVFVGAGNVGLHAVMTLALVQRNQRVPRTIYVVDFDRVEETAVNKGYPSRLTGRYKAEAAVEMVREAYGLRTSAAFHPIVAAAQSVPGLIREAGVVFNGTDSTIDAAYVSEEARNAWEARLSTGIFGERAVHTVEVQPPGYTLGEVSYDSAAWSDAARHQCQFGTPENTAAGIPQPFGALTGALAVQVFLSRRRENREIPFLIRMTGEEIVQSYGPRDSQGFIRLSREIPFSYDQSLSHLWRDAAGRLGLAPEDICLGFPIPLVTRQCAHGEHGQYQGFERFPVRGRCPACGEKTYCLQAPREVSFEEIAPLAHRSLLELHSPAGMGFAAWTRDGTRVLFHLPFRQEDIPELEETEAAL
jgi:predicted ThiF/HesA family dinucleotide-utilizing enzyme